jgi:hypothetical protein
VLPLSTVVANANEAIFYFFPVLSFSILDLNTSSDSNLYVFLWPPLKYTEAIIKLPGVGQSVSWFSL